MDLLRLLAEAISAGRPVAMVTIVEAPGRPDLVGRRLLAGPDGAVLADEVGDPVLPALAAEVLGTRKPADRKVGELRAYAEPFLPGEELVVVGAGHVAQPVAQIGKILGFRVTVIDDRPDFANATRFPWADQVICEEFGTALRALKTGPRHYFVLVTRGHRYDMEALLELINRPAAYIGMIGSRTRVATILRLLKEEHGIDPAALEQVYTPIGLDIGAQTPAEIALSITAELVKVRRGGTGESLSRRGRQKGSQEVGGGV